MSTSTSSLQSAISLVYVSFLSTDTPYRYLCFILLNSFFFNSYFQVSVLTEVVPLSCMRSSGMQSLRLTLARELKMTKREELKQNSRHILDGGSKSEDPSRVNNSTTSGTAFDKLMARRNNRRVNRKDFRIDTEKLIMSIPFNGKKLSLKRRVLNSTLNAGIVKTVKIVKTYYGKLDRVFTEYKCHRATFYCSPTFGGLGRCVAVKTFYVNINKVLTTACKCRD